MRTVNIKKVLDWSKVSTSAVAEAVREATEVGVIVPSLLRAGLTAKGFVVTDEKFKNEGGEEWKVLKQVKVWKDGALVAMGASGDYPDALLHAVLGYVNENPA